MLVKLSNDVAFGDDPDDTVLPHDDHGPDVVRGEFGEQSDDRGRLGDGCPADPLLRKTSEMRIRRPHDSAL